MIGGLCPFFHAGPAGARVVSDPNIATTPASVCRGELRVVGAGQPGRVVCCIERHAEVRAMIQFQEGGSTFT